MYQRRISEDYEIREVDTPTFKRYFDQYSEAIFDDLYYTLRPKEMLTEQESALADQLTQLTANRYRLNLAIFHENELVGWSYGYQETAETFNMANSAIFDHHRRRGLYSELLKSIIELSTQKGFQKIYSRHNATNNAVIIAKLKMGFHITALEMNDTFGVLVQLTYFPKELRRKALDFRSGKKPDAELRRAFRMGGKVGTPD